MVKKGSKRCLNTGNTIRYYKNDSAVKQYCKYGYLVIDSDIETKDKRASATLKDMLTTLPTHIPKNNRDLEFSLNKQRRWEIPSYIKHKVAVESDSKDVHITVQEHDLGAPDWSYRHLGSCTAYFSNVGSVRECVSTSEMNIKSAQQGHREQDHLSKLERRALKKMKRTGSDNDENEEDTEVENELPSYQCDIVYSARRDAKFYKEIATKGFFARKSKKQFTGWGKRFQNRHVDFKGDDYYCDDQIDSGDEDTYADDLQPDTDVGTAEEFPISEFVTENHRLKPARFRKSLQDSYDMV